MIFNWKKSIIFFILGFVGSLFIIVILSGLFFYFGFWQEVDLGNQVILVEVKEGQTLSALSGLLKEKGVIKSEFLFKIAARNYNIERKLQVGFYEFSGKLNGFDVLKILQNQPDIIVTFPEGKTVEQFAEILEDKKVISKAQFLEDIDDFDSSDILGIKIDNFEGYLFPDTYYFKKGQKTDVILKTILKNFKNKVLNNLNTFIQNSPLKIKQPLSVADNQFYDILKLASIIEKEVQEKNDKKIVSGILWKRLQDNYFLQVDSTLNYILKTNRPWLNEKELKIDSPYNTYKFKGLPPTPIANPGLESIQAAFEPLITDYYFYLTDQEGKTHFSKTYQEHLENIKKYLR